jgi:hypothetical protein
LWECSPQRFQRKATITTATDYLVSTAILVLSSKRERERKHSETKDAASVTARLPFYTLEMTLLKDFIANLFCIEEAGLLGCSAVWLGNYFLTFRRNIPPSFKGYESVN